MSLARSSSVLAFAVAFVAAIAFAACGPTTAPNRDNTNTTTGADGGTSAGTDAGTTTGTGADGGVQGCGAVTPAGDCSGDTAQWCDSSSGSDQLAHQDCANITKDAQGQTIGGHCAVLGAYGSWCAMAQGTQCEFTTSDGSAVDFACGDASGANLGEACDVETGCTPTSITCAYAGDGATFTPVCDGGKVVLDCTAWNQAVELSCTSTSVGGTGCQNGTCVGLKAGSQCDATTFLCAAGLTCDATSKTCK